LIPAAILLVTALLYLPTLKFPFVFDDSRQIDMSQSRFTWSSLPGYFTDDVWSYAEGQKGNYYRPIFLVWLLVNFQAYGLSYPLWHATTVGMHLLATLLVFLLARRLTGELALAAIAALLFGIHPVHVESVAWISGVTDPLLAVLFLGALLCYLRAREAAEPRQVFLWRSASVALFALAVFSKEAGIVLPALVAIHAWLFPKPTADSRKKRIREAFLASLPYLQVTVVYLAMRLIALGGRLTSSHGEWPLPVMLYTWPKVAWFYLRQLIWPVHLSVFHSLLWVLRPGRVVFLLGLLVAGAMAWWVVKIAARRPRFGFLMALAALPLLPAFALNAFSTTDFVHDRYLYLPSAGFLILAVLGAQRALEGWPQPRAKIVVVAVALVIVSAPLVYLTLRDSQYWRGEATLASRCLELYPENSMALHMRESALYLEGRCEENLQAQQRMIEQSPRNWRLRAGIGGCLMASGNWSEAASQFRSFAELQPGDPRAYLLLGITETELGELDQAEIHLRHALKLRPRASLQYSGYHYALGSVLERKGDLAGALAEYDAELDENPGLETVLDRALAIRRKLNR
jgi:tetratricopeptide (TPR) repeat protein